jgi:hypothetical protein
MICKQATTFNASAEFNIEHTIRTVKRGGAFQRQVNCHEDFLTSNPRNASSLCAEKKQI